MAPLSTPNYNNNPASAGGIVSSDPGTIAQTIAAMNKQVLQNATPVARQAETARQAGQITAQQAETMKTDDLRKRDPGAFNVVSTAAPAMTDLSNKKGVVDGLSQGMADQSAMKAQGELAPPIEEPEAPVSARDVADEVMGSMGIKPEPTEAPSQQDSLAGELDDLNKKTDEAFESYNKSVDQLKTGTFPLTVDQQAQIDATKANFARAIDAQKIANQNFTSGMTQANIASGRSRYAPEIAMGEIQASINTGLQKIAKIEGDMSAAVAELKQGFTDHNYTMINDQYEKLSGFLKEKTETISTMQKNVQDHLDKMAEMNQKAEQNRFENALKLADFDQKEKKQAFDQIMASDKFSYEQRQDAIKNMMDSDKFSWQQKQDNIKNALEQGKFSYQQRKDLQDYQLDLKKLESADTPDSYKEWKLAGQPGNYASYLKNKVDAKPPTADQSQSATYATRMKDSNDTIGILTDRLFSGEGGAGAASKEAWQFNPLGKLSNPDVQRMEQAQRDFINAVLRKESGAAIAPTEFDSAKQQYFPQPGDTKEVIDQKTRNRKNALMGISNQAGPALSDEFRNAVNTGKTTYFSVDDYVRANPQSIDAIEKIGKEHPNWSDDDILQILQAPDDEESSGFNQPPSTGEKGSLSEKYESGGNPGVIGYDSTGGLSYGAYQLAHKNAQNFISQSPYAAEFKGIPFNSQAFQSKWKEVAKKDPEGFKSAQKDFIEQTHVGPQIEKLASAGFDVDQYSPVLRDVIFSTAVQHGPKTDVVLKAAKKLGPNASEEDLIKEIYKERWAGGARFASSTPEVKKSVYNRFFGPKGELNTALALVGRSMA